MRILLSVHHELLGSTGAAGTTLNLAAAYRSMGHDVRVHGFDALPGYRTLSPQARQLLYPFAASAAVTRHWRWADVVDGSSGDLWPLLAARRRPTTRGPAVVTSSHGLEHLAARATRLEAAAGNVRLSRRYGLYHGGWRLREVALSLRRADAALFLNDCDRKYATARLGVTAASAHVVTNGLSPAFIGLPRRRGRTLPPVVALLGAFSTRKGSAYSVPALSAVLGARKDVRARFLGTGVPRAEVLRHFATDMRARIDVVESYEQETLPGLLADADIGVFASVSEGFGNALLEMMACGVPPVAASSPGPSQIIHPGDTGVLVPVRDAAAIAGAILQLLSNEPLRSRLAASAYSRAQGYTWEAAARGRLEVYRQVTHSP